MTLWGSFEKHAIEREFLPGDNVLSLLPISGLQACMWTILIQDKVNDL